MQNFSGFTFSATLIIHHFIAFVMINVNHTSNINNRHIFPIMISSHQELIFGILAKDSYSSFT